MSVSILRGTNDKPASSQALKSAIEACSNINGLLFIGYPIVRASDGPRRIDALLVSPDSGLAVFDLIEGSDPGDYTVRQDDAANMLEARLKTHRELMRRRELRIPINALSFAPAVPAIQVSAGNGEYPITGSNTLRGALERLSPWNDADRGQLYEAALSAIENISTIRTTGRRRTPDRTDSRGSKLKMLEASIATMDAEQGRAVIETVDGVQRIRGLAGSGKTSATLKNIDYRETYRLLVEHRAYNVKMCDGALIQMMYEFSDRTLLRHRLSFMPAPHLDEFQNRPETYLEDELHGDIVARNVVPFPLRYDYDARAGHRPMKHPLSHLTLGQYNHCRVPVSAPVTPHWFVDFIIRNFYHTSANRYADEMPIASAVFNESILPEERRIVHIVIPVPTGP